MYNRYTKKQEIFIYDNRALEPARLVEIFNRKFGTDKTNEAIKQFRIRRGWLTGRSARYKKGNRSWNTDTKGKGVCKANKGSFKKGDKSLRRKPVGSEVVPHADGRVLIKTAEPSTWQYKHIVVWEQAHGKIPDGHVLRFKDSNPSNYHLENLVLVSTQVHMHLNRYGYKDVPEELKPSVLAVAKLECEVFAMSKN